MLDTLSRDKRSKNSGKTLSTPSEDEGRSNQDPFAQRQSSLHQEQRSSLAGSGQTSYQMLAGEEQQRTQHSRQALHQSEYPAQKHHSNLGLSGQDM